MKRSSKRLLGITAAALLITAGTGAVLARGGQGGCGHDGPMQGGMPMMGQAMKGQAMNGMNMQAMMEQRLQRARQMLGITPEQEPAWQAFETAMRERMAQHQSMRKAGLELYRSLTPEQQERVGRMMGF